MRTLSRSLIVPLISFDSRLPTVVGTLRNGGQKISYRGRYSLLDSTLQLLIQSLDSTDLPHYRVLKSLISQVVVCCIIIDRKESMFEKYICRVRTAHQPLRAPEGIK